MKVALVGPELEENLGLRYLHSSLTAAGHTTRIFEFHGPEQTAPVAAEIQAWGAEAVGLSMVFTARAREFVGLASLLREKGFSGPIIAGGHFASFHSKELLEEYPAIDFIVHGEGELTLVDLLENIRTPWIVAGISYRDVSGAVLHAGVRPNPSDLDTLPWPLRTPPFFRYMGIPIANVLGSRGCFGSCSFCSITAWYRQNTGPRFRQRSVNSIVMEMARLYHSYGVRIFNFHDDTFFMPDEETNIERFGALESALQSRGMTDIALQVKARTDAITPRVLEVLRRIGLFRVFLGVENFSNQGLRCLGKGTTVEQNRNALRLLRDNRLHITFNLLMFGPNTTVEQLRENIECIREFGDMPVNFGRVEVYSGTPLERDLRAQGRLKGDIFGYHYDIADQQVQNIFEAFRTVFTERNFQITGLNFEAMKLDYYHQILSHFFPHRADEALFSAKQNLLMRLNQSNADLLSRLCNEVGQDAAQNRRLGQSLLRIRREFDRKTGKEFAGLVGEIERRARQKKVTAATFAGKAVACTAAAAAVLVSAPHCKWVSPLEPAPGDPLVPDTLNRQVTLPQFDSGEVAIIEQRISACYKNSVDSLGYALGFVNKPLQFNLCLASGGTVDSFDIISPTARDSAAAFIEAVRKHIATWTFPETRRAGVCGITMTVAFLDTSWHVCEVIGYPLDTPAVVPPVEYDSADAQLVRDKFYATGLGAVDSLSNEFGCTGRISLTLYIDAQGNVTDCSVGTTASGTLPQEFIAAVKSRAAQWRFPGVSRAGYCTVTAGLTVVVPPTIFEIMAFPSDTTQ